MKRRKIALGILLVAVCLALALQRALSPRPEETETAAEPAEISVDMGEHAALLPGYLVEGETVLSLRELCLFLADTNARFDLAWDPEQETASITTGRPCRLPDREAAVAPEGRQPAEPLESMTVDGNAWSAPAWQIGGEIYVSTDSLEGLLGRPVILEKNGKISLRNIWRQGEENAGDALLSLVSGEPWAICNGQTVLLSAAPFVEGDMFFFPLQDTVELLGGTCRLDGQQARVELAEDTFLLAAGDSALTKNGTRLELTERQRFAPGLPTAPAEESFAPRMQDGVLFLPAGFGGGEAGVLGGGRWFPEEGLVILGALTGELGTGTVKLGYSYDLLPPGLRSAAERTGTAGQVLGYDVVRYDSPGLTFYVMEDREGGDPEGMDGKICALEITAPGQPTPRGLEVGQSRQDLLLRYGPYYDTMFAPSGMHLAWEGDAIRSILFYSRYFGSGLCVSPGLRH